ncbi:hypothetical protein UY3_18300 [Chelonia mydas]|uniref:Uncharacterized protein n=1 Tax=Chelonia mydas TaxID=8469 RepID=M7AP98_CHEMY|nr:hypothetical protein UY3_18300 [Chelonia mydas]
MLKSDLHSSCLWCLRETHQKDRWPGRNPGPTLGDTFSGLCHFHAAFHCASTPGTYGPDTFASGPVIDSGTILGSDFGTGLHDVDAPVSHACTVVDLYAGTYGPGVDVGTGPPDPGGSCERADAAPSGETAHVCYDAYGPGTDIGTVSVCSNSAPAVT